MNLETKTSNPNDFANSRLVRLAASAALLGTLAACASGEEVTTGSEAHFSVECLSGGIPAITEVAGSGVLPVGPKGKLAWGVVRLACAGSNEPPVIVQDTIRGGACLGYNGQSHLIIDARQPGLHGPEYFVATRDPAIGVTGPSDIDITRVALHRHDLADPDVMFDYKRNNCDAPKP